MSDHAPAVEQTSRSVAILGADALLVALPSTPTQLANACFAGGFDEVFPATWGDELIAAGCLEQLESRTGPAIFCACPLVAEQLRGAAELRRFIVPLISPPVAVARYLRTLYPGDALRITYVGDCPGADDEAIDARLSPGELLSTFAARGILPSAQRPDLGDHVAHDRRRFYSLPGGVPSPQWLGAQWPKRTLVDVHAGDALAGLANQTLSRGHTLIDFAPHLGCACAGAVGGTDAQDARKAVIALEPPRAQAEVVSASAQVEVSLAQTAEHHVADVTWGDFLAALPAALAMHPEDGSTPVPPRQTSRTAPRRAVQKNAALPRAYMAARAGVRRERVAKQPADAHQETTLARARREQLRGEMLAQPSVARADASIARREEISLTRPNPWIARRASQEGMTGPRGASTVRAGLSVADRWLLSGLMLASSVLVAVLTSALTVHGIEGSGAPAVASTHAPAAAPIVVAATPARDTTAPIGATHAPDSAMAVAAPHADSASNHQESGGTVAPPPSARLSPMPAENVQLPKKVAERVERKQPAIVEHAPVRTRVASPRAKSLATSESTSASAPPAISAPITSMPPSVSATTSSEQPVPVRAAAQQPAAVAAAPVPGPASVPASAAGGAGSAPATAASANSNAQVLEELRAIHAEINARKRHVDSLTAALDSLRRVPTPQ